MPSTINTRLSKPGLDLHTYVGMRVHLPYIGRHKIGLPVWAEVVCQVKLEPNVWQQKLTFCPSQMNDYVRQDATTRNS